MSHTVSLIGNVEGLFSHLVVISVSYVGYTLRKLCIHYMSDSNHRHVKQ